MALDPSTLANALGDVFAGKDGFPATAQDAGKAWASAYSQYAALANAGPTKPVTLDAAGKALGGLLGTAFAAAQAGDPSTLTTAMDAAFVAFWLTPPVAFAAAGVTGVVTIAPPGVLDPLFKTVFGTGVAKGRTAAEQAQAIADVLHTWTRTVIVANTPPVPPAPVNLT